MLNLALLDTVLLIMVTVTMTSENCPMFDFGLALHLCHMCVPLYLAVHAPMGRRRGQLAGWSSCDLLHTTLDA